MSYITEPNVICDTAAIYASVFLHHQIFVSVSLYLPGTKHLSRKWPAIVVLNILKFKLKARYEPSDCGQYDLASHASAVPYRRQ